MADEVQKSRERFLQGFPQLKVELEAHIAQLRQLADWVDKTQRDTTISTVTASSAGILSVLLGVAGFLLAPFTGALSTALGVTGVGLGVGSAATGTGTAIAESVIASSTEEEVKKLISTRKEILEKTQKILGDVHPTPDSPAERDEDMQSNAEARNIQAKHKVTENVVEVGERLNLYLACRAMPMNQGIRVLRGVFRILIFGLDVYRLVEGSKDLAQGGNTELSGKLREQARELEMMLQELNQLYESMR